MYERLSQMKRTAFIVFSAIYIALWVVSLIFCRSTDKVMILVTAWVVPALIYGFIRLCFKIIGRRAPQKYIGMAMGFFAGSGLVGIVVCLVGYVTRFPNADFIALGGCIGLILGILDEARNEFGKL